MTSSSTTTIEAPDGGGGGLIDSDSEDDNDDDQIVINVGGIRHETKVATLMGKAGTRLSFLAERHQARNTNRAGGGGGQGEGGGERKEKRRRREYFFDRHPIVFTSIIDYYRNGELHVPLDVCGAVVRRELDYWLMDETLIEPCCWMIYSQFIENQKTLTEFNLSIEQENDVIEKFKNAEKGWKRYMMHVWMVLDHPRYSKVAMAYAVTSFAFVLASITGFCVETLSAMNTAKNATRECWYTNVVSTSDVQDPLFLLECLDYVCTVFFTVELVVRVVFAPCKTLFFRSLMNVIDILALLPLYVQFFLEFLDYQECLRSHRAVVELIFILRIIRIFRIFHLVKHYKALKILVHAIRASIQELLMLSIFLFIAMLVFSTVIFYAERPTVYGGKTGGGRFQSIPTGFWYAIITMTTVGYGDVYPETALGRIVGALCALCGVLLVALTIPVISNNFALFYMHARNREEMTKTDDYGREGRRTSGDTETDKRAEEEGKAASGASERRKAVFRPDNRRCSRVRHPVRGVSLPGGGLGANRKWSSIKKKVLVRQDPGSATDESKIINRVVEESPAK